MRTPLEIVEALRYHKMQFKSREKDLLSKQTLKSKLEKEIADESQDLAAVDNIILACKLMLEKITYQNKTKIENFVTYALKQIFTDRDYAIELEIKEDVKRPALTLMLIENGIKQDIKDSVGGGIITTLGFLLQIYYLEVYNKNKIMFIDEGLKEVSKSTDSDDEQNVNYLNNLLNFLKWLSTDRDYKFVIVTHDESVRDIADSVYRVNLGDVEKVK